MKWYILSVAQTDYSRCTDPYNRHRMSSDFSNLATQPLIETSSALSRKTAIEKPLYVDKGCFEMDPSKFTALLVRVQEDLDILLFILFKDT